VRDGLGNQLGHLYHNNTYGDKLPFHASTRGLFWTYYARSAPYGTLSRCPSETYDISGQATIEEVIRIFARAVDFTFDFCESLYPWRGEGI
jgi:hypothetical protein